MTKSTKRSAAKTRRRQLNSPPVFVDECLGRSIALRLQSEGYDVRPFDEFAGQADVDFLPVIGQRGWILLTKDKNVRKNQLEVLAILNAGVRAFVITATGLNHQQLSDLASKVMPKLLRISRQRGPFVFNITATGAVSQIPSKKLRRTARRRSAAGVR